MLEKLIFLLLSLALSAEITGISTKIGELTESNKKGSLVGGTRLYFRGDFSSVDPSTFLVLIGTEKCTIRPFYTSSSYFECETPPPLSLSVLSQQISVYSSTGLLAMSANAKPDFTYSHNRTPLVSYVNPTEGTPGDEISFYGRWPTKSWFDFEEALVTGQQMDMFVFGEGYSVSKWNFMNLTAVLGNTVHGDTEPQIRLANGIGLGHLKGIGESATLSGEFYHFRTLGRVDRVSGHVGSSEGGMLLKIEGAGFPAEQSLVQVEVDGVNCEVSLVKYGYVECLTGKQMNLTQDKIYQGSAGLIKETWYNEPWGMDFDLGAPNLTQHLAVAQLPNNEDTYIKNRMYGLFKAPETGNHTFYIASDDYADIYLSTDEDPDNKTLIIDFSSYTSIRQYFYRKNTVSGPIALEKDQVYYLEIRHYNGAGSGHFSMGVETPSDGTKNNTMPLVQHLHIEPGEPKRESQYLTIETTNGNDLNGGDLKVKYKSKKSDAIPWNSEIILWDCSDVISALWSIGLYNMLCELTRPNADNQTLEYNITFNYAYTDSRELITFDTKAVLPSGFVTSSNRRVLGNTVVTGSYSLSFNGETSEFYDIYKYKKSLEDQLNKDVSTLKNELLVYGSSSGSAIDLYFYLPASMFTNGTEYLTIAGTNLEGGNVPNDDPSNDTIPVVTLETLHEPGSSQFWWVVPSDFLRTIEYSPQVRVWIDNTLSICRGDCSFYYTEPPMITGFSVNAGVLTITGTGMGIEELVTSITVGNVKCPILQLTATEYNCTLPEASVGSYQPIVTQTDYGNYIIADSVNTTLDFNLSVTGVSPPAGGTNGGTYLTITGTGFWYSLTDNSVSSSVTIGGNECEIRLTSSTELTCVTPSGSDGAIEIAVGAFTTTSSDFTYDSSLSMEITSVSPTSASTIYSTEITVTGTSFGSDKTAIIVKIGDEECLVKTVADTSIVCTLLGGPKGVYDLVVYKTDYGQAWKTLYPLIFEITSISADAGSLEGGLELTITGNGFATIEGTLLVLIGSHGEGNCTITEQPDISTIKCLVSAKPNELLEDTAHEIVVMGKLNEESDCIGTCMFTWDTSLTPTINEISPPMGVSGTELTITGAHFGNDPSKVTLKFGEDLAIVSATSDSSIIATVPDTVGGEAEISLFIAERGNGAVLDGFVNEVNPESVTPNSVSQGGGVITINGAGFSSSLTVSFGTIHCEILEVASSYMTCRVSEYSADEDNHDLSIVETENSTMSCDTLSQCQLQFLASSTPHISGTSGELTISGAFISDIAAGGSVMLGEYSCPVVSSNASSITCTPNAPPGSYQLEVYIDGLGYATGANAVVIDLRIDSIPMVDSSYAGGMDVTVSGLGLSEDVSIHVCGRDCEIVEANGVSLKCETPLLLTNYSYYNFEFGVVPMDLDDVTVIGSSGSAYLDKAYDNDITTFFSDNSNAEKWVGVDVGERDVFKLHSVRVIGGGTDRKYYKNLENSLVQGSPDSETWVTLHTFETVHDSWNEWIVSSDDTHLYRYYRIFKEFESSRYYINELAFKGHLISNATTENTVCDLTVTYLTTTVVQEDSVAYSTSNTPQITLISPDRGSTAGGDTLTLSGSGFGTDSSQVTVLIDDINCEITSTGENSIICTTGARTNYVEASLKVSVANKGHAANKGLVFLYSELWSDERTWGGLAPPRAGELVSIPKGKTVILDTSTPVLNSIVVEGTLIIEDIEGLTLEAHYIMVQRGTLQIGTELVPIQNNIKIILHGNRASPPIPIFGNKVIAVYDGVLDIHGKPRTVTWTSLDLTALANTDTITVLDDIDWVTGEEIVIAPTGFDMEETERRTIASVTGKTITLTENLQFEHYAATEAYGNDTIDMRAEVGLLTRNIQIRGSAESLKEQHGVHIMVTVSPGGKSLARVEYLEIFYAGQAFSLGRYPIHYHMLGAVPDYYIRGNSIHDTYNRAITMHGVHYLRVSRNVAYNNMGHAFFVEDGIETKNTIEYNLGLYTVPSWSLLATDQTPGTFWITNFDNYIRGNHAAGGVRYGFWFDPPVHPTGPSSTTTVCPEFVQLGEFKDNVAHSYGHYGLRVFHGHIPLTRPCDSFKNKKIKDWWTDNPAVPARYENFTGWKNRKNGAIIDDAGAVKFVGFKVADNGLCGIEMAWTEFSEPFTSVGIEDALVIGKSGNTANDVAGAQGIITAQTDGMFVNNVRFHNFAEDMFAIGDESKSQNPTVRDTGARVHKLANLTFTNSHKRIHWEVPFRGIFDDLDGSLTGTAGQTVAAYYSHLLTPECSDQRSEFNSIVCESTVKVRRVMLYGADPSSLSKKSVMVWRSTGEGLSYENRTFTDENGVEVVEEVPLYSEVELVSGCQKKNPVESWNIPLVTGYNYSMHWGSSPLNWDKMKIGLDTFEGDDFVLIKFGVTDYREGYVAERGVVPSSIDTTAPDYVDPTVLTDVNRTLLTTDPAGTYYWDEDFFAMIISATPGNENQFDDISITGYRCLSTCDILDEPDEPDGNYTTFNWSDPNFWGGQIPVDGQTVWVEAGYEVIIDQDTAILQSLEVNGKLVFAPNISAKLRSHWIFVRSGTITSGGAGENYTDSSIVHEIELHGDATSPAFAFTANIEAGNKVLVNTGSIELYGTPRSPKSLLQQNAKPGDGYIFVSTVDWGVGDNIVIASSAFDDSESEVFSIIAAANLTSDADWNTKNSERSLGKGISIDERIITETSALSITSTTKLTLSKAVSFYHPGTDVIVKGKTVDMRTEVALLNRNVKISGTAGSGCNVITAGFTDENGLKKYGKTMLSNVEINNCGQTDTFKAALRFIDNSQGTSSVESSVIKNSNTWGVYVKGADNISIKSNVFYNTFWRGVVITKTTNSTVNDNYIINVLSQSPATALGDAVAGILSCPLRTDCSYVTVNDNRVSGSYGMGFLSFTTHCVGENIFANNLAHSVAIGILLLNSGATCVAIDGFTAYFTEFGFGTFAGFSTMMMKNVHLADNDMAMGLKSAVSSSDITFDIEDLLIIGTTHHSLCEAGCNSRECRPKVGMASSLSDVSSTGVSIEGTTMLLVPPNTIDGDANTRGGSKWNSVTVANFNKDTVCNKKRVIFEGHPNSPDFTLPQTLSNFNILNSDADLVLLYEPLESSVDVEKCGNWACTGPMNQLLEDLDGSFIGGTGAAILSNNPGIAKKDICAYNETYNGYLCNYKENQEDHYEILVFESRDEAVSDLSISPINITSHGTGFMNVNDQPFSNDLNTFMDHVRDGFYSSQQRTPRFPSVIYSGFYYNISLTGPYPVKLNFYLQHTLGRDRSVILSLKYPSPNSVHIYQGAEKIAGLEYSSGVIPECSFSDPHGTNRWFHNDNVLQFVMRNEDQLTLEVTASVRLNMRIDMTVDEFFSGDVKTRFVDRLAAVLNIPSYRIRIVNVYSGSVGLDLYIDEDTEIADSSQTLDELQGLSDTLTQLAQSGELSKALEVDVLDLSVTVSEGNTEEEDGDSNSTVSATLPDRTSHEFTVFMNGYVLAIIIGIVFVGFTILGIILYLRSGTSKLYPYDMPLPSGNEICSPDGLGLEVHDKNPEQFSSLVENSVNFNDEDYKPKKGRSQTTKK